MISQPELQVLSYYRACELAGALLFGRLALHTTIDEVRIPMTRHCFEEAEHAWLWTKTIRDLGHVPLQISQTYQTEYGKEFGMPNNTLEIFCLTQVFEKRTLWHFQRHLALPDVPRAVRETLQRMIDDEGGHISWIRGELDRYSDTHGKEGIEAIMRKLEEIDERVYNRILNRSPYKGYFRVV